MNTPKTPRSEVVIGLVGAVGTDLYLVADVVDQLVSQYGYHVEPAISLSGLLNDVQREHPLPATPRETYIDTRMDEGNRIRRELQRGDALALLAVAEIVRCRRALQEERGEPADRPPEAVAYILRSLKHQDEVTTLREIYRERFVCISAHAPREERIKQLATAIAESHGSTDRQEHEAEATRLAQRDEKEENDKFGQDVRGTFPRAEFFIDASHRTTTRTQLGRCLDVWFGFPFASPTRDEFAMFHAHAAAARSTDLSRQVGAAIATDDGDIIAVGCNEVPAYGGGAYWFGDRNDARDFMLGVDANARVRAAAIEEVRNALVDAGWIEEARRDLPANEFASVLEDTRVDQLTEFGRAVHAEMAAILDAARRGAAIRGASLFTTTFPCHNCAKHIVGSGIERVVYIAPYPKSLAEELHPDSIALDPRGDPGDRVVFRPFVGIAPLSYLALFQTTSRRKANGGRAVEFDPLVARPKLLVGWDLGYIEREDVALVALGQNLDKYGVELVEGRALPAPTLQ